MSKKLRAIRVQKKKLGKTMSNLVGKTLLNRYNVQKSLGRGGMAEVYKVWDSHRKSHLAMKVLLENLAIDKVFMRRFAREANTLSELQHQSIVRFYGLERDGRLAFMLMDYIDGGSLKLAIFDAGGAMPLSQISGIMRPICFALSYAHHQNFIHCDIKSDNIMLNKHGEALLMDFGIARMSDAATATMVGAGTPAYMAPEQARGEDPIPQTDIYALGIVLYEMLTGGERPFTGEQAKITGSTSEKVRWEQVHAKPTPPSEWNPNLSPKLEKIILKCLKKDARKRYANTIDLYNDLEIAIGEIEAGRAPDSVKKISTPPKQPPVSPPIPPKLDTPPPTQPPPPPISDILREKLAQTVEKGKEISQNLIQTGILPTFKKLRESLAQVNIPNALNKNYQKWHKANRWLLLGSIAALLVLIFSISSLFSKEPSERIYYVSDRSGKSEIYYLDDKGQNTQMTYSPENSSSWGVTPASNGRVYFVSDRSGKDEIHYLNDKGQIVQMTYSPENSSSWGVTPASNGRVYFVSNRSSKDEIYYLDDQGEIVQMTYSPKKSTSWGVTPASNGRVYFVSNRSGKDEIFYLNDQGNITQMTYSPENSTSWGVTPASNGRVYFVSDRSGKDEIYYLDDKGQTVQMSYSPEKSTSWGVTPSVNGRVYFVSNRSGKDEVYYLNDKGQIIQMTYSPENSKSWGVALSLR